jgi:orotate phosphoribosyltransferase
MAAARLQRAATDDSGWQTSLFEIIKERSFRQGRFTLASGAESDLYFNLKPTMMDPLGAYLAAKAFSEIIHAERVDYVGGLEMGAVPIIGALAAISATEGRPIRTFFVRKAPKEHGTKEKVEGLAPSESLQGKRVLVLDDVATSGGSIMKAIDAARSAGATVDVALVLVDRDEGAKKRLADQGIRLLSVFQAQQFL